MLWRDADALPEELVFNVNYLGGNMPTFALNFSRPGAQVVAQYYNFFRLGREGFRQSSRRPATSPPTLSARIGELGPIPADHQGRRAAGIRLHPPDDVTNCDVFAVSAGLRERGWQVPAYTFPANRQDLAVLRIVVRNGTGREMADLLLDDLVHLLPRLQQQAEPIRGADSKGFDHATAQRKT